MDEERRVVDEQEFLENLMDGEGQPPRGRQRSFSYTQRRGCFDFRSWLIDLAVYAVVLMVTSGFFPASFRIAGIAGALETAWVMSVLNIFLKPLLIVVTLPLTFMSFGLFYIVINGIILYVASLLVGNAFVLSSFGAAILASVFISLLRMGINHFVLKDKSIKFK